MRSIQLKRLAVVGIAAGVLVLGAPAAQAKQMYGFKSGVWQGGAYSSNKTGNFSHCAASARYKSGITLVFSVNRSYQWKMSFAKSSWNLRKGNAYPIVYRVDRARVFKGKALAINPKMAIAPLPGKGLFRQMRRGKQLFVKTRKDVLAFSLNGSSRMLSRLVKCVKRNNVRATDPFGDVSDDPFGAGAPVQQAPRKRRAPRKQDDFI